MMRPSEDGTSHEMEEPMETAVGIALIVIAALEIVFIVRTVQANMTS